ncbi:hypothetical protein lerEdw1_010198 [Lerista edwardsae]|nr:hypothetical protein lerEdw1_010198 [Lerista edwardsae]
MQRFRTPVVDAPVAAIGSSSVLPVDSDGLPRDPVDRRIEQAVRRAFDAAAGSLRASVAGSMFSRAVFLWIRELLADFDVPAEMRGLQTPGWATGLPVPEQDGLGYLRYKRAFSDIRITSSGPGMMRPYENLNLGCKVTGFAINTQSYAWNWVRRPPGKGLERIGGITPSSGNTVYAPPLKSHATISADASKNELPLQLSS